jgi:hypothetical protein
MLAALIRRHVLHGKISEIRRYEASKIVLEGVKRA